MLRFILRFKGGKGSGNFGHKGRPGSVGGSSSSAVLKTGMTAYHVTVKSNVDSISKTGLRPASEVGQGFSTVEYDVDGVFVGNAEQVKIMHSQLSEYTDPKDLVVYEVYLPKGTKVHEDPIIPESSLIVEGSISKRNLRIVDVSQMKDFPKFDDYQKLFNK